MPLEMPLEMPRQTQDCHQAENRKQQGQMDVGAIPEQQREGLGTAQSWGQKSIPHSIGFGAAWLPLPQPPGSWDEAKRVNSKYSGQKKGEENSEKEDKEEEN